MPIGSLIDQVSGELNDFAPGNKFTVWSREQIRAFLGEGLVLVYGKRPELFVEEKIIKVEPCVAVQDICDCSSVRTVLGQSTEGGRIIKTLRRLSSKDSLRWPGKSCFVDADNFRLKSYSIDGRTARLRFYPQVPAGVDVWVLIECSVKPIDFSDGAEYEPDMEVAAVQWALWKAKMIDAENNATVFSVAQAHHESFWRILDEQKRGSDVTEEEGSDAN